MKTAAGFAGQQRLDSIDPRALAGRIPRTAAAAANDAIGRRFGSRQREVFQHLIGDQSIQRGPQARWR